MMPRRPWVRFERELPRRAELTIRRVQQKPPTAIIPDEKVTRRKRSDIGDVAVGAFLVANGSVCELGAAVGVNAREAVYRVTEERGVLAVREYLRRGRRVDTRGPFVIVADCRYEPWSGQRRTRPFARGDVKSLLDRPRSGPRTIVGAFERHRDERTCHKLRKQSPACMARLDSHDRRLHFYSYHILSVKLHRPLIALPLRHGAGFVDPSAQ
jgi:hypothetical protein